MCRFRTPGPLGDRTLPTQVKRAGRLPNVPELLNSEFCLLDSLILLHFHPLDLRAETCELFIKHFVTTIDMIHAVDFRSSVC